MKTDWEGKLSSKKDFQDLLLEILNPLLPYYSERNWYLALRRPIMTKKLSVWKPFPGLCGGWFRSGQAAGIPPSLRRYTGKGWQQGRIRKEKSIGEGSMRLTSVLWKWQPFPMG